MSQIEDWLMTLAADVALRKLIVNVLLCYMSRGFASVWTQKAGQQLGWELTKMLVSNMSLLPSNLKQKLGLKYKLHTGGATGMATVVMAILGMLWSLMALAVALFELLFLETSQLRVLYRICITCHFIQS